MSLPLQQHDHQTRQLDDVLLMTTTQSWQSHSFLFSWTAAKSPQSSIDSIYSPSQTCCPRGV